MDVVNDLHYAQITGARVNMTLVTGEAIHTGIHEVNEEEGVVSIYAPQAMNDFTTTKKIELDLIGSVMVHKEPWFPSRD
jgi:hypothetical protein